MTEPTSPVPAVARYAIMVDVGYVYAAAGELLMEAKSRREYRVDADGLIKALTEHAARRLRGELLRVYWYDAARDRVPTIDQRVIAQMAWVKLRLGNLNARGQQKGVDAQIRADMEALARHRAVTDAVLVAGDEDMVPAVEAAQAFGVHVHLWGVEPPYGTNQAERLVWESDTVEVLDSAFLKPFFSKYSMPVPEPVPEPARGEQGLGLGAGQHGAGLGRDMPGSQQVVPPAAPSPAQLFERVAPRPPGTGSAREHTLRAGLQGQHGQQGQQGQLANATKLGPARDRVDEAGEHVAQKWILTRGRDNIRDLLPGPVLPPVIDKELLVEAEKELGRSLRPYQEAREWLRDAFWARVHREFGFHTGRSPR
jgi:uncharacterized LabA/DUF88 family protein